MVSPLKTWQYDEPKRLWLALGGLSVLAHIGVLGLSLPYILTIMQPSGERSLSSAVPVELVADSADRSSVERAAELAESQTVESKAAKADSEVEANARAADSAASPPPNTEPDLSAPPKSPPTMSTYTKGRTQDQAIADSQNNSTGAASGSTGENGSATASNTKASTGDNLAGLADSGSDETQVIDGTGSLPDPKTANNGTSSGQVAYLSILGSSEIPKNLQKDIVTSPPRLTSNTADVAAIERQPQGLDCGRVDFSQPTGTYKIVVDANGKMKQVTLWTEGIERDASESERAIACLLESAGLTFEPAQFDGQAVLNDNLLLTVEIIEAQQK